MNKNGKESFDAQEIAENYTSKFQFYVDILSILGADIFSYIYKYMSLFGLFKLFRVMRIGKMIS